MICSKCNTTQESGKYCGTCGVALMEQHAAREVSATVEANHVAVTQQTVRSENVTVEKAKDLSRQYGNYALELLKQPSHVFASKGASPINGLITVIFYALAFSLSLYFLSNGLFKVMGEFGDLFMSGIVVPKLPFFYVASRFFFASVLLLAGGLAATFACAKGMGSPQSFKRVFAEYGGYIMPFTALNIVAILFGLMGSAKITLFLLGVSLFFAAYLLPGFIVSSYAEKYDSKMDKLYWSIAAIGGSALISYIIVRIAIMEIIESLSQQFNIF